MSREHFIKVEQELRYNKDEKKLYKSDSWDKSWNTFSFSLQQWVSNREWVIRLINQTMFLKIQGSKCRKKQSYCILPLNWSFFNSLFYLAFFMHTYYHPLDQKYLLILFPQIIFYSNNNHFLISKIDLKHSYWILIVKCLGLNSSFLSLRHI